MKKKVTNKISCYKNQLQEDLSIKTICMKMWNISNSIVIKTFKVQKFLKLSIAWKWIKGLKKTVTMTIK